MKTFKKTLTVIMSVAFVTLLSACKKDDDKLSTNSSTNPSNPSATADITLTAGGEEFKVVGPCGWAVAGGTHYIGANHATNSQRAFSAFFNIDNLPSATTTYTLVQDANDTDPTHITMNITEIASDTITEWSSTNTSGSLTLVVEGNKVSVNLSGITLAAQTNSGFFVNGNVGNFANPGVLSGTMIFYK